MINLSVVIPIYKTPELALRRCMDSVCKLRCNVEILCCVDSPGDTCEMVAHEIARGNPRVKVFVNDKNYGVSYSRNFCLSQAVGKYVTFVDADDEVFSNVYEVALDAAIKEDADAAVMRIDQSISAKSACGKINNGIDVVLRDNTNAWVRITEKIGLSSCSILYRRKLLMDNGIQYPNNVSVNEDFVFVTRFLFKGVKVIDLNLVGYRVIGHQLSTSRSVVTPKKILDVIRAGGLVLSALQEDRLTPALMVYYWKTIAREEILLGTRYFNSLSKVERYNFSIILKRMVLQVRNRLWKVVSPPARILLSLFSCAPGMFFAPPCAGFYALKILQKFNLLATERWLNER